MPGRSQPRHPMKKRFSALINFKILLTTALATLSWVMLGGSALANIGGNLDQFANGGTSSPTPGWQNGNLGSGNSTYKETKSVPFRFFVTGLADSTTYSFTIQAAWTKSGKHTYDYFTSYDRTESSAIATAGGPISNTATPAPNDSTTPSVIATFLDPRNQANWDFSNRPGGVAPANFFPAGFPLESPSFNLVGYHIASVSLGQYYFTDGPGTDLDINIDVTFTTTAGLSGDKSAGFFWGGHLGSGLPATWGLNNGASSASGSSFHMSTDGVGGGQDKSMQAGAVVCVDPDCSFSGSLSVNTPSNDNLYSATVTTYAAYLWAVSGNAAVTIDGSKTGTTVNVDVAASASGTFTISLTVADDFGCDKTCSKVVAISSPPPPQGCTISGPQVICATKENTYSVGAQSGVTYTWTIDTDSAGATITTPGGTTDNSAGITATQPGSFNIHVVVSNGNVAEDTFCDLPVTVCSTEITKGSIDACYQTQAQAEAAALDATTFISTCPGNVTKKASTTGDCTATITVTVTDSCGDQTVTYDTRIDGTPPNPPSAPDDVNGQCDSDVPAKSDLTATDDCDGDIKVSPTDSAKVADATGCGYTITRTWTFTDKCGNESSVSQIIHIQDTTKPVAPSAPDDVNGQCDSDVPAKSDLTATDNCDGDIKVSPVDSAKAADAKGCGYTITRTWTFTDKCGNESSVSQIIHIQDTTKPVAPSAPDDVNGQCDSDVPAKSDLTATDNCDGDIKVSPVDSAKVADAKGCGYTITRTWTFTDKCGNSSSVSQKIHIQDTTAPIIHCPPAASVGAADSLDPAVNSSLGVATATDNCDQTPTVTYKDGATTGDCPKTFVRTWTAVDDCLNSSTCTQTITVFCPSLFLDTVRCTLPNNTLQLTYTPDSKKVGCYKLNATVPGSFYTSLTYTAPANTPVGTLVTFKITLPYPWITSGANPIHAYDSVTSTISGGQTCLTPGKLIFTANTKQTIALNDYVSPALGSPSKIVTVTVPLPATRFIYLDVHADYGLVGIPGTSGLGKGNLTAGFLDAELKCGAGAVLIPGKQGYSFGATQVFTVNVFK
jgi:hypothetical protein